MVFRAPKKTALEENRVRRGLFKYYLLIKRAPADAQSPLFGHFFGPRAMYYTSNDSFLSCLFNFFVCFIEKCF